MTDQSTAALDEAAAEAVANDESEVQVETEQQGAEAQVEETPAEESAEESDENVENVLYHKLKSDFGRKDQALHRRMDELRQDFNNIPDRIREAIEAAMRRGESPEIDEDEPLTLSQYRRLSAEEKAASEKKQKQYDDKYRRAVQGFGSDLTDDEWQDVVAEMGTMPLNSSGNPEFDAERNFLKAERAILRKKLAQPFERKNPLKGDEKPPGVTNSQKTVVKETPEPKLTGAAQSYIEMVEREDGEERAANLRKTL